MEQARNDRWLTAVGALISFLLATMVFDIWNTHKLKCDVDLVTHTHEVISSLENLVGLVYNAESSARAFAITGAPGFLKGFTGLTGKIDKVIAALRELTADDLAQQAFIEALSQRMEKKIEQTTLIIADRECNGFEPVQLELLINEGQKRMNALMVTVSEMINHEVALLDERIIRARQSFRSAVGASLLTSLSAIGGILTLFTLLHRYMRKLQESWVTSARHTELLRTTLASIGDGVITTDNEGIITNVNREAERLTGWTAEEAIGQPHDVVFHLIDEREKDSEENPVRSALENNVIVEIQKNSLLVTKSGSKTPIDDSAAPIRYQDGRIVGCVLVFRDVTEKRRLERELSESHRRKDEFLATLAHELRNPLAPCRNALQVLDVSADEELRNKAIAIIERQMEQVVRLVDDLMDVNRISQGKIVLRKAAVEVADLIRAAVETSQPLIDQFGLKLEVRLPDEKIILDGDPTRLSQILSNLLTNAAKYNRPAGRIWLNVEREGSEVVIRVRDTGIGIERNQLPRIFEIFAQVDDSLEKAQGGLGIGLSLVKSLVELHGGTIRAESAGPGQGSEFIVRLPTAEQPAPREEVPTRAKPQKVEHPRRVLIVDDNRDGADSMAMLLRILGNETQTAYDGEEGLQAASLFHPDVILLDIGMPKLNGYDACRRIREEPWGKRPLVIAVTGWGQEMDRDRSKAAGFDHHLVKPVDPAEIVKLISDGKPAGPRP